MIKFIARRAIYATALLTTISPAFAGSQSVSGKSFAPIEISLERDPNDWSFTIEPYIWAMGNAGKIGVNGFPAVNVDFNAKTILQHLDWGIMGRGEVRKGRWGLLADALFAQLSAGGDLPASFYDSTSIKIQQGMASLALAYRLIDDRRWFLDVYAGARYNYMGINGTASTDSAGIANYSDAAVRRISQAVGTKIDSFIANNGAAIVDQATAAAKDILTTKALEKAADIPEDIDKREAIRIIRQIQENSVEYRAMVTAVAEARVAAAKNQLTSAIQNRVDQAQKKLAKAISRTIEDTLPTSYDGSQWWVDPIIGLRAQVNFTRWLFLAAQGDVGGFCAGSDIAWNVQATLGVNFTRNIFGEIGYRYFYMDYANGGALYQAAEFGIFTGIGMRF